MKYILLVYILVKLKLVKLLLSIFQTQSINHQQLSSARLRYIAPKGRRGELLTWAIIFRCNHWLWNRHVGIQMKGLLVSNVNMGLLNLFRKFRIFSVPVQKVDYYEPECNPECCYKKQRNTCPKIWYLCFESIHSNWYQTDIKHFKREKGFPANVTFFIIALSQWLRLKKNPTIETWGYCWLYQKASLFEWMPFGGWFYLKLCMAHSIFS